MFDTMGISISPTTEAASMFNHLVFLHRGDVESFTNRFINKSYESIVCLPNKIVIKLINDNETVDGVVKWKN